MMALATYSEKQELSTSTKYDDLTIDFIDTSMKQLSLEQKIGNNFVKHFINVPMLYAKNSKFDFCNLYLTHFVFHQNQNQKLTTEINSEDLNPLNIPLTLSEFSFINELENKLWSKQEQNSIDHIVGFIFKTFEEKLIKKEYNVCNIFLEFININNFNVYVLIALLTVTLPWEKHLSFRKRFYEKVKIFVYKKYSLEESSNILKGLE